MAKKAAASSPLASITIEDLQKELRRRRSALPGLEARRNALLRKLADVDAKITALGGPSGSMPALAIGPRKRGRPPGSGKKVGGVPPVGKGVRLTKGTVREGSLIDFLRKALNGKTMGVDEALAAVKALGYQSDSPNFKVMVNASLLKKQFFKRIARGKYTAA